MGILDGYFLCAMDCQCQDERRCEYCVRGIRVSWVTLDHLGEVHIEHSLTRSQVKALASIITLPIAGK